MVERGRLAGRRDTPCVPTWLLRRACLSAAALGRRAPAGRPQTLAFAVTSEPYINQLKLSTTDLLVPASMKNAAKCDK